jgi:MoaA/NifB/PqqE/SkfB family radical SAM enzyme
MAVAKTAKDRRPIVVWISRACNLKCVAVTPALRKPSTIPTSSPPTPAKPCSTSCGIQGAAVLFSGGEPLVRPDLFDFAARPLQEACTSSLSTNGTLIDQAKAKRLKELEFAYVGISLDSAHPRHPRPLPRRRRRIRACMRLPPLRRSRQRWPALTLTRHTCENLT